jgi:hypothetical protein
MSQTQVQTSGIANDAVTAAKIPNGAVGNTEIDDGAVSFVKISEGAYRDSSEGIRSSSTSSDTQFATEKAIRNAINGVVAGRILNINSGSRGTKTLHILADWTDTGLQVNITPTSISSKIIIVVVQPIGLRNKSHGGIRIRRNNTTIYEPSSTGSRNTSHISNFESDDDDSTTGAMIINYFYIDSPATISTITYSTQGRGNKFHTNSTHAGNDSANSLIYAIEISQ